MANPATPDPLADRIYDLLTDDDDERVCEDIPKAACEDVPANFFLQGGTRILTRLGDEVANAKTVLPWMLATLGASDVWISWLVPVRESMSMLPQLAIANVVERSRQRKFAWVFGSIMQAWRYSRWQ